MGIFHTIIDFPKPVPITNSPDALPTGDIVLENVNFAYPGRPEVKVLDNLSLRFPAGKVTAIVGPSGAGKSTIVGIVERWYEFNGDPITNPFVSPVRILIVFLPFYPSGVLYVVTVLVPFYFFNIFQVLWCRNGLVTVSGTKLSELNPQWWRSHIGLVQQDNILFDTSIFENVAYGLVGTEWETADNKVKRLMVEEACRDAFADEFISRLPDVCFFLTTYSSSLTLFSYKSYLC